MKYRNFTLLCQSNNESVIFSSKLGEPLRLDYTTSSKAYDTDISFLSPQTKIHEYSVVYDNHAFQDLLNRVEQNPYPLESIQMSLSFHLLKWIHFHGVHIPGQMEPKFRLHLSGHHNRKVRYRASLLWGFGLQGYIFYKSGTWLFQVLHAIEQITFDQVMLSFANLASSECQANAHQNVLVCVFLHHSQAGHLLSYRIGSIYLNSEGPPEAVSHSPYPTGMFAVS
jgi:hypothetical protein